MSRIGIGDISMDLILTWMNTNEEIYAENRRNFNWVSPDLGIQVKPQPLCLSQFQMNDI